MRNQIEKQAKTCLLLSVGCLLGNHELKTAAVPLMSQVYRTPQLKRLSNNMAS